MANILHSSRFFFGFCSSSGFTLRIFGEAKPENSREMLNHQPNALSPPSKPELDIRPYPQKIWQTPIGMAISRRHNAYERSVEMARKYSLLTCSWSKYGGLYRLKDAADRCCRPGLG